MPRWPAKSRLMRLALLTAAVWLGIADALGVYMFTRMRVEFWPEWPEFFATVTAFAVLAMALRAAFLAVFPRGLLRARRERLRAERFLCLKCGYPLKGVARGGKCPECGSPFGWIR